MLPKPDGCLGCPLFGSGTGFSKPDGYGSLKVMLVGEALGAREEHDGLPFRPYAEAGSMLMRALRLASLDRQQFGLWNVVACRPPGNELSGHPDKEEAIDHCRQHFTAVVKAFQPSVLMALGNIPLQALTGMAGEDRSISDLRGYVLRCLPYAWLKVVPSFHPSYIRRGAPEMVGVLVHDIKKAVAVATGKMTDYCLDLDALQMPGYITDPSVEDAGRFLDQVLADPGGLLSYDLETDEAIGVNEDERVLSQNIRLIQFSLAPGTGIAFPWTEPFISIAKAILASPVRKAAHNGWRFDNPILRAAGFTLGGELHDSMVAWHHLQPDLPANLQFVASFYGMPFPWKHLSGSDLRFYGCADVDAVQRILPGVLAEVDRIGLRRAYDRHLIQMQPLLERIAARGLLIDQDARQLFRDDVQVRQIELGQRIQTMVPDSILSSHPAQGYKRPPADLTGLTQRTFPVFDPETGVTAETVRWCRLKPFNSCSHVQLKRYMKARGHRIPRNLDGDETTGKMELARLARSTGDAFYLKAIEYRELDKMGSTYLDGYEPREDGRIHTTFTFRPATGQLSSMKPNVQNIPRQGELARSFRKMIVAAPGHRLVEFDYRSFHVLTLGFEAQDPDYIRMARIDPHSFLAAHMLHLPECDKLSGWMDDELREYFRWFKSDPARKSARDDKAKRVVLGYGFGLGPRKLYHLYTEYFISEAEARRTLSMLDSLFPRTALFRDRIKNKAYEQSYLISRHGYIRWFHEVKRWDPASGKMVSGKNSEAAIAYLPANDAFGHIKDAMLRLEDQGWNERAMLINQIHDSLVFEISDKLFDEAVPVIKAEMERPSAILIDSAVAPEGLWCETEIKAGRNWGDMEEVRL